MRSESPLPTLCHRRCFDDDVSRRGRAAVVEGFAIGALARTHRASCQLFRTSFAAAAVN